MKPTLPMGDDPFPGHRGDGGTVFFSPGGGIGSHHGDGGTVFGPSRYYPPIGVDVDGWPFK